MVEVEHVSGSVVPVWAAIRAAQEQPISPSRLLSDLKKKMPTVGNALIPLRYDPTNSQPQAEGYVNALIINGWKVRCVVSLGESARPWLRTSGLPYIEIPNSGTMPSNAIAARVRVTFGWL